MRPWIVIGAVALGALACALFFQWHQADMEGERLRKALARACEATHVLSPVSWVPTIPPSNDPHGLARGQLVAACSALE